MYAERFYRVQKPAFLPLRFPRSQMDILNLCMILPNLIFILP